MVIDNVIKIEVVKVVKTDLGPAYKVARIDYEDSWFFLSGISILHKIGIDIKIIITRYNDAFVEGGDDCVKSFLLDRHNICVSRGIKTTLKVDL